MVMSLAVLSRSCDTTVMFMDWLVRCPVACDLRILAQSCGICMAFVAFRNGSSLLRLYFGFCVLKYLVRVRLSERLGTGRGEVLDLRDEMTVVSHAELDGRRHVRGDYGAVAGCTGSSGARKPRSRDRCVKAGTFGSVVWAACEIGTIRPS